MGQLVWAPLAVVVEVRQLEVTSGSVFLARMLDEPKKSWIRCSREGEVTRSISGLTSPGTPSGFSSAGVGISVGGVLGRATTVASGLLVASNLWKSEAVH